MAPLLPDLMGLSWPLLQESEAEPTVSALTLRGTDWRWQIHPCKTHLIVYRGLAACMGSRACCTAGDTVPVCMHGHGMRVHAAYKLQDSWGQTGSSDQSTEGRVLLLGTDQFPVGCRASLLVVSVSVL